MNNFEWKEIGSSDWEGYFSDIMFVEINKRGEHYFNHYILGGIQNRYAAKTLDEAKQSATTLFQKINHEVMKDFINKSKERYG
jgi:hypothetical protein